MVMSMRQEVNQKKAAMKQVIFLVVAAVLVVVTFLMVRSTRQHMEQRKGAVTQRDETVENYREMEEQYLSQVQAVMAQAGYPNSGVTMTYVTAENGDRHYTVQIHHRRLEKMKTEEQEQLKQQVEAATSKMASCNLSLT